MNRSVLGVLLPVLLLLPTLLSAQIGERGVAVSVDGIGLTIGGRVQTQFNTSDIEAAPASEILIRRARIEIGVQVDERVSGVVQPDFGGGSLDLKDAYLNVAFSPGLQVLVGNAYRPFGLLEQTSSKRILPIERGLRIRGLSAADEYALLSGLDYSNRDIGLQVHGAPVGAPLGLAYEAGILRGPVHGQIADEHTFQYAGRVTIRPIEPLRLGVGWSRRDFAGLLGGTTELRAGDAFEVDFELGAFAPGFHLLGELSRGEYDPFLDLDFWGAHAWLGYRTEEIADMDIFLEPILRVSHSSVDRPPVFTAPVGGTLITPGLNLYLTPLNRVMVNYDIWRGEDEGIDAHSFKMMFQLAF